jgi:hypothetical protein
VSFIISRSICMTSITHKGFHHFSPLRKRLDRLVNQPSLVLYRPQSKNHQLRRHGASTKSAECFRSRWSWQFAFLKSFSQIPYRHLRMFTLQCPFAGDIYCPQYRLSRRSPNGRRRSPVVQQQRGEGFVAWAFFTHPSSPVGLLTDCSIGNYFGTLYGVY